MAKILAIIKKDIRLYFASPISLVFFIVLPIMFTVVLAFTTGGFGSEEIVLSYVDQANTPLSANLVQLVEEGDGLKTEVIDLATAQAQFAEGKLDAYLVIPVDFNTETLLKGSLSVQLFQQPNRTSSQTIYQALRLALTKLTSSQAKLRSVMQVYQTLHPEVSAAELENLTDQLSSEIQLEIANAPSRLTESVSQKSDEVIFDPCNKLLSRAIDHLGVYYACWTFWSNGLRTSAKHPQTFSDNPDLPSDLFFSNHSRTGLDFIGTGFSADGFRRISIENTLAKPTFAYFLAVAGFCTCLSWSGRFSWQLG